MGVVKRGNCRKMKWGIFPVALFLILLCIGTISSAQMEDQPDPEREQALTDSIGPEFFVDGTRVNNGTGTEISPFNNMEDAIAAAEAGSTIWITGTITIGNGEDIVWSINKQEKPDVAVKRHKSFTGILVLVYEGSLELTDITLDGNKEEVEAADSLIYVESGTFVLQKGSILKKNKLTQSLKAGGALRVSGDSEIEINGKISENEVRQNAGAVYMGEGGIIEMNDAEITYNTAYMAGGMEIYGDMKMYGGKISNNTANMGGGLSTGGSGIFQDPVIEIWDGEISHNTASDGSAGGIIATNNLLKIYNSRICDNKAAEDGGGVYIALGCMATIEGGEISGNSSNNGGGIFGYSSGTVGVVGLTDVKISDNTASRDGGGIYWNSLHLMTVTGCEISANNASASGGGVYLAREYSSLRLVNSAFSNNTASEAYFWTVNPDAVSGNSYYHKTCVQNCTYSQGPIDEEKTIYSDFTNAYNNYDVSYKWNADQGKGFVDIDKTILSGGADGVVTPGEELTYKIAYEVKNFDGILSDVYIQDILPDGVELKSCSGVHILYDKDENIITDMEEAKYIRWNLGDIKNAVSGSFTVSVEVLKAAGDTTVTNKAGIIAEQEYQEKWDEVSIEAEVVEVIEFLVPDKFEFGSARIESKKQYFGLDWQNSADKEAGENIIAVEDTRQGPGTDWSLYASLSGKVRDQDGAGSNILNDVLVYCEGGTETVLTDSNLLIADKSKYSGEYSWISEDWYQDYEEQGQYPTDGTSAKGLYMVLQPGQGSINQGGSYKGEITWIFAYTP